jgi:hypothetical protein
MYKKTALTGKLPAKDLKNSYHKNGNINTPTFAKSHKN